MNGPQGVLWHCRRPYGIVRKDNHVSGSFFDFSRRHCPKIESLAPPAARCGSDGDNYPPKGRKPVGGAKESFLGGKRRPARRAKSKTDGGESISSAGDSDENRRKSVCGSVCTFGFRRAEEASMSTGSRAKAGFRWLPYVAVCGSLKRKRAKRLQLPKEAHKVHTASSMFAQPYCQADSCLRAKKCIISAYGCIRSTYGRINVMEV